jgi:2-C-methyl-D-erythritol 4-phosphate cytidylyltransferase
LNAALILAGGKSERLTESAIQKQFIEIAGKPLMMYSVIAFQNYVNNKNIIIVAPREWHERIEEWIGFYEINKFLMFAEPGRSRQHSILSGLNGLRKSAPKRVIVHDAARPNVSIEDIEKCMYDESKYDGATPALSVNDTIYQSIDGVIISSTLNRDTLFAGQTPECYDYEKYLAAHEMFPNELDDFRGSSEIAVKAGMTILLTEGNIGNHKITTKSDLEQFKAALKVAGKGEIK